MAANLSHAAAGAADFHAAAARPSPWRWIALGAASLRASRLIISQGTDKLLVYFWFVEGGQHEAGEYAAKFRLFANAVLHNRRDGALVRFVTPVAGGDLARADPTLKSIIAQAAPLLPAYVS